MARGIRLTTEEFIAQSTLVHGDKYDYSLVRYKNTHTKVTIICPIHGEFSQLPMDHKKRCGCDRCSGTFVHTQLDIIQKIKDVHGELYDYSKVVYKNIDTKITLGCKLHGDFNIAPRCIMQQHQGCRLCGCATAAYTRRTSYSEFVTKATAIHGDKYSYASVVYTNNHTKVNIVCATHGVFKQAPDAHINKHQGCPRCGKLSNKGIGGYTHAYFKNNPLQRDIPGILYAARFINGNETFIKVGITSKSTKQRFNRTEYKNMIIDILYEKPMSLYEAFCKEQYIIEVLLPHRFYSNTVFSGYTEIYRDGVEVKETISTVFV